VLAHLLRATDELPGVREDAFALDELEEVGVPGALVIVLLERRLAARLEEIDGRPQRSPSRLVELRPIVGVGIEQNGTDGDRALLDAGQILPVHVAN